MSIGYVEYLKYFKIYDIIYMKQKNERNLIVTGLYPNETDRKRSGTRVPLRGYAEITDQAAAFSLRQILPA